MRDHAVGRAPRPDPPRQRARVDPGEPDPRVPLHPPIEPLDAAERRGRGHVLAHDHAQRMRRVRLDIVGVGADIADMGKVNVTICPANEGSVMIS